MSTWEVKIDYLKNEKSFWSKIKIIFPCFTVLSFRYKIQTSKNVADTTFKNFKHYLKWMHQPWLSRICQIYKNLTDFKITSEHLLLNINRKDKFYQAVRFMS